MRAVAVALTGLLAGGLASCQTAGDPLAQTQANAVALEGFVGVPEPVGRELSAELARAAEARRLRLVPASDASARWVVRGYLAPGEGALSYVWDVYDREGRRAHRLAGDMRLAGTELTGPAARGFAEDSAAAIGRFVASPPRPEPAAAAEPAPQPAAQPSRTSGRRAAVEPPQGLDPAQAAALAAAAGRILAEAGFLVVAAGQPADLRLAAEATLNPAERGRSYLTVLWRVADGEGRPLGEVRQIARVEEAAALRRPEPVFARSVETALPGIAALAAGR
jgi:pyruvate/2-oxoglutarate dehydrogenase complex dihydrolipoamide acyltransferase (E2) component